MNKKKIIYSILKELNDDNTQLKSETYNISSEEFGSLLEMMQDENLIKDTIITRAGQGNKVIFIHLANTKIKLRGIDYLETNSSLAKTYKGLKEIREWLPL